MTGLIEFGSWWLVLAGAASLLFNSVVVILATSYQKRKAGLLLKESQREVGNRIRQLEEDLASSLKEQSDHWSEVRNTIARLEFRSGGTSEHFQRPSMVGLDKKHQVCSLARQGLAAEEISRKLNLYPGETELVLGLRKYGAKTEICNARTSLQ